MIEKKYIVYRSTNKVNGKMYIGITCRKLKVRIRNHKSEAYNKNACTYNTPFKRAIRKYGIDNFVFDILEENLTQEEASQKEIYYIAKFNTYCHYANSNGYNATTGGESGRGHPIDRVVQLDRMTGELIETYPSNGYAEQIFGNAIFPCLKKQIRNAYGYCWMYEKEYLSMTKKEVFDYVNAIGQHVIQFDLDGNILKIYETVTDAAKECGISTTMISRVMAHKRCTCANSVFMYYSDYLKYGFQKKERTKYMKPIFQLDDNKEIIREFPSLTEAAKFVHTKDSNISTAIGRNGRCAGYYWKFKEKEK